MKTLKLIICLIVVIYSMLHLVSIFQRPSVTQATILTQKGL